MVRRRDRGTTDGEIGPPHLSENAHLPDTALAPRKTTTRQSAAPRPTACTPRLCSQRKRTREHTTTAGRRTRWKATGDRTQRGVPTSSQRTARQVCERAAKSASAPIRADLWDRKRSLHLARGLKSTQREGRRPLPRTGEQGTEVHSPDTGGAGHSRRDPTSKAMPKAGPRRGWR